MDRVSMIATMLAIFLVTAAGCGRGSSEQAPAVADKSAAVVCTTFYPTTYFAERIAGGLVEIDCPLPAGADPITWAPSVEAIGRYQAARLILVNGANLEQWIAGAPLPRSRLVDTTALLTDEFVEMQDVTHSHGPTGDHSHEGIDVHTWMDPLLAVRQAEAIRNAMALEFPEYAAEFEEGFVSLREDLLHLNESLLELTAELGPVSLIASHPAYNYLARRYGWDVVSLDLDPGLPLDDAAIEAVRSAAAASGSQVLLWERDPGGATAAKLAEQFGIASVVFSPCEQAPDSPSSPDYLATMGENIASLRAALHPAAP